jgi:hypothetical protein
MFDFLKPKQTQRKALPEIKTAIPDGTKYYLRARNIKSMFDDTLVFDSERMRQNYIDTAKLSTPYPSDWYFNSWETTAEERLQQELETQRKALQESYKQQIAGLEYKIRLLQQDLHKAQKDAGFKVKYETESHARTIEHDNYLYYKSRYDYIVSLIEQTQQRKTAESTPTAPPDITPILTAIQKDIVKIMSTRSDKVLAKYEREYQQELERVKAGAPLQGKLVMAIIERQLNNAKT